MDELKQFLIDSGFYGYIKPSIITFTLTMGAVYASGRMLDKVKTRQGKNSVALLVIIVFGPLLTMGFIPKGIEDSLMIVGIGILSYTLIGMRLFSRVDKIQDAKLGEDDPDEDLPVVVTKAKPKTRKVPVKAKKT